MFFGYFYSLYGVWGGRLRSVPISLHKSYFFICHPECLAKDSVRSIVKYGYKISALKAGMTWVASGFFGKAFRMTALGSLFY